MQVTSHTLGRPAREIIWPSDFNFCLDDIQKATGLTVSAIQYRIKQALRTKDIRKAGVEKQPNGRPKIVYARVSIPIDMELPVGLAPQ